MSEQDPIAELLVSLRAQGKPSLAWVVRWTHEGRDPVAAAWDASRSVDDMTSLIARAWPERLEGAMDELERRLGPGWYHRLSSEIAPVLRHAVPVPPTLRELLALASEAPAQTDERERLAVDSSQSRVESSGWEAERNSDRIGT